MRKLIVLMGFVALGMSSAFAQKGEKAVGVNLNYGTEASNLGIGAKFQYGITEAIRAQASFDYFLKKDFVSMWDININAHYLFPVADRFKVYPLVGLTYTNWNMGGMNLGLDWEGLAMGEEVEIGSSNMGRFGVNLGAGAEFEINEKLAINFEAKYQLISDFNQAVIGLGLTYRF